MHRSFWEQRSREWMATDRIQYIQLRLSSKHPKTHICDYHANLNAYELGLGIYPKAKAPQPPFHPHCLCLTAPIIDLNPLLHSVARIAAGRNRRHQQRFPNGGSQPELVPVTKAH